MPNLLILEGIATSGKSSIIQELVANTPAGTIKVFSETQTHLPIQAETTKLHIEFFMHLVHEALQSTATLVVFDRFYLTQAVRAGATMADYAALEDMLAANNALVVCLQVDETAIEARIAYASKHPRIALENEHSGQSWADYIASRGKTIPEIAAYYAQQQRTLLVLASQTKLQKRILNTTSHHYQELAQQILNLKS